MSSENAPGRLTLVLVLAALLLMGSGAAYYLQQMRAAPAPHTVPVEALYETALDASAAAAASVSAARARVTAVALFISRVKRASLAKGALASCAATSSRAFWLC